MRCQTSAAAIAMASTGTIHTSRKSRRRLTRALGISSPLIGLWLPIPDGFGVEALRGEDGEDHHGSERNQAGAGDDAAEVAHFHERHEDRAEKNVEHRPRPDHVDELVD